MNLPVLLRLLPAFLALATPLALGACGGSGEPKQVRRLFSPSGEPLNGGVLGLPSCEEAMSKWFDRIDAEHRGGIGEAAFLEDARRQFRVMDQNHDGVVTPAELASYRAPFAIPRKRQQGGAETTNMNLSMPATLSHRNDPELLADFSDPVMVADRHFRNVVSEADFLAYEHDNFVELNTARNGRLSRKEVLHGCEAE